MNQGIPIIELEWRGDLPTFHCPVCGHPLWAEESESAPCEHILFSFVGEVNELDFHNDGLKQSILAWARNDAQDHGLSWDDEAPDVYSYLTDERELDMVDAFKEIAATIDSTSAVCFMLTSWEVSCGPMAFTVVVGVDFYRKMQGPE